MIDALQGSVQEVAICAKKQPSSSDSSGNFGSSGDFGYSADIGYWGS
jgi:hypothetical protein